LKAIILAAGRGSRMRNLTDDRPKCLVELRGKPLLDWQLKALHKASISEVAVVTGYKREQLIERGVTEFYNPRWQQTNMVSSLACASTWLETTPCVVSYSDIFYETSAIRSLITCPACIAVTYDPHWKSLWEKRFGDPLLDAETFRLTGDGNLAEIGNSPKNVAEIEGQYMGLLRFSPEGWSEIMQVRRSLSNHDQDAIHMTGILQKVIEAGRVSIAAVPYHGEWGEIDSADDLALYQTL